MSEYMFLRTNHHAHAQAAEEFIASLMKKGDEKENDLRKQKAESAKWMKQVLETNQVRRDLFVYL